MKRNLSRTRSAMGIIDGDKRDTCFVCQRVGAMHKHHIFGGANRKWSEKYGLYVHLCPEDHNMSDRGVHFNKELMDYMHRIGQESFERKCGDRSEFMAIFGRNYL